MKIVGHLFKNMPKLGLKSTTDEVSLRHSNVYREFLAEREEIMKHKWIESEKAGHDIGYDRALLDWILNHRDKWRVSYRKTNRRNSAE